PHQRFRGLVILILHIAPGVFGEGGIGLPELGTNPRQLPALHIKDGGSRWEGGVLIVDRHLLPPFRGPVVVVGGELLKSGRKGLLMDPPVEPDQLRPVLIYQFAGSDQPVLNKPLVWRILGHIMGVLWPRLRRTIETIVLRVLYVGGEFAPSIEEPPVLRPV